MDSEPRRHSVTEIAQALTAEDLFPVELPLNRPRTVWVAMPLVHVPKLEGIRWNKELLILMHSLMCSHF